MFFKHKPQAGRRNWPWPWNSSERGLNASSVWIRRKSVQRFPRYFIHKQKSHSAKSRTTKACQG